MTPTLDDLCEFRRMKRLMILIDGSDNDRASLRTATATAGILGARLTVGFAPPATDNRVVAATTERHAGEAFDDVCGGLENTAFIVFEAPAAQVLATAGHGWDLVILERISHEEGPEIEALNAALFDTGRPVMLAPPEVPPQFPHWAAIAWNGSTQAARAVAAAVPLLSQADGVTLLVGNRDEGLSVEHITDFLAGHDISVSLDEFPSAGLTARARGRALLKTVREIDANFLVAGAYGENRRNSIFGLGRATQKIATATPIPVLLHS
jgi:nucleotide-binding universal stress UspA family protein